MQPRATTMMFPLVIVLALGLLWESSGSFVMGADPDSPRTVFDARSRRAAEPPPQPDRPRAQRARAPQAQPPDAGHDSEGEAQAGQPPRPKARVPKDKRRSPSEEKPTGLFDDLEPAPPPHAADADDPAGGREAQRRGRRSPGPGPLWSRLSPEEREAVDEFILENFPRMHGELSDTRGLDGAEYERRVRRVLPDMLRLMELNDRSPKIGRLAIMERRLDMERRFLAMRFHSTEHEDDRAELRREIEQVTAELFDIRQQRIREEITALELRLGELKQHVQQMSERREEIIHRKLREQLEGPPPGRRPILDE